MRALPRSFYNRDTALVARQLIGKLVVRDTPDHRHTGRIVETEAYLGIGDLASHAAKGLTPRTRSTWGRPGLAYVYRIYGIHWCLNAATLYREPFGAVLIRALELEKPTCCDREFLPRDGAGPGKLCQTLDIAGDLNGHPLDQEPLRIAEGTGRGSIVRGPRIGISRAANRALRFAEAGNPWVSRPWPRNRILPEDRA